MVDGELEKKKGNLGFQGKGFEFNEEEANKVKEFRKELSKTYGLSVEGGEEEDELLDQGKSIQQREDERRKKEDL